MTIDGNCARLLAAHTPSGERIFVQRERVIPAHLASVEAQFATSLSTPYKNFLLTCGAGDLSQEMRFLLPREVHAFDVEGVPWHRFLAIASDERGNFLAFDPREGQRGADQPVYYVCHDPYGYGRAARGFEAFLGQLALLGFSYSQVVERIPAFQKVEPPKVVRHAGRPWWRFW